MNKFTSLKAVANLDNRKLSEITGIDMVEIYLFERGMAPISYEAAHTICDALEVDLVDMFPSIEHIITAADNSENEDEVFSIMRDPENRMIVRSSGIDPDEREWIMIVDLVSGIERRYKLSSIELDKLRSEITSCESTDAFLYFYADCQQIVLRKNAIAEITFLPNASYASFRSKERAFAITIVSQNSVRPEVIGVTPDGGVDGTGERSFASLLKTLNSQETLPPFILVDMEEDEERYISISGLEVLEVPMGVMLPEIYGTEAEILAQEKGSVLESMDAQGSA